MVRKPSPERRTQLLESALRLFVANGVQQTSTAAIAKEAGTAAGTLFLYFPTKQDLINELTLKIGREQSEYIQSLLQSPLPAREIFSAIWNGSVRWFLENMDAYRYFRQVRESKLIDDAVVRESEEFFAYYFQAIQKGLEEGVIKPYPFELTGEMLYESIIGVMNLISRQPDRAKQEEYILSGFNIFWDGIKTEKG
jgi:AcrR family transcriptional regulator